MTRAAVLLVCLATACRIEPAGIAGPVEVHAPGEMVRLPNEEGSLKFAVVGDFGTGGRRSYQVAAQMAKLHESFPLRLVLLTGDNLYGEERPQDFVRKFETPYRPLLDAGVKFHAALGNHDAREQRFYERFNMGGKLYYSFKGPGENVRFFALDSTYPVPEQIEWLEEELRGSTEDWKIVFLHHPPYSSGGRHGSDVKLRQVLEPLFVLHGVSVVFTGHDHFYERTRPQQGIVYFVVGSGGRLAPGDIRDGSSLTARGYDLDQTFLAAEISGDIMTFNAISRVGRVVDSGIVERRRREP